MEYDNTTFNEFSPEVKDAVRTSLLPGNQIWKAHPLPQPIEVLVRQVL